MKWILRPQEYEGSYFFSGSFFVTSRVHSNVPITEILWMYHHIHYLANVRGGLDYVQVFEHSERDIRLYFVDQLNTAMIESGFYTKKDNFFTLMYSYEY